MVEVNTLKYKSHRSTSYEEQAIFYYVRQVFSDAINRGDFCFIEDESIELDIYIPSLHLAIEYDGAYWHKNKIAIDNHKNLVLSNAGVHLIRVRECGLDELEYNYGDIVYRTVTSRDSGLHLNEAINRIFELIKTYIKQNNLNISPESNNLLESIYIAQEKVIEDRPNIYAQYYNTPQEDSIANSCLIKYWDYEKNGNLRPENVSIKSGIYITLTCPQGHSYCLKPSNYKLTNIKKPSKCSQCMLSYCPGLIGFGDCKEHCDIYKHVLQNIKYIPKYTIRKSHYHSFTSDKEIKLKKVSCSEHLIENANILYENDIRQFYVKLSIEKDSMKSEEILNFFLLTKPVDQLELINHISNTYTSYPILLNKVKDALSGKIKKKVKGSGWRVYFNIPIVDELAPTKVINNIRFWGIQYFSFITLKIFDYPNVMDEFCKTVLDSYGNTGWDFCYLNLTDKIKRDFGSLSADFCKKLYFLINQMNKIDHHYLIEDCITTLKTALYSI